MRRVIFAALIAALVLVGCGGEAANLTVPDPPKSSLFEQGDNQQVDQFIAALKNSVPEEMKKHGVKDTAEQPIVQQVYQSTASLQEIADFYKALTQQGWVEAQKMPGIQDGVLITGYDNGNTTLVVNAVDAGKFGGDGVVIYTVKGTK
ncbi:MAG TPA: hypothetical protein VFO07_20105 [Roseiflexaceae bacterium]|nr:hypothetical protein [Roseiflexaceae bacterium]